MSSEFDPITGYPIDTSPGTTTGFTYDPISGAVVDTAAGTPGAGWGMPGDFGTFLTDLQAGTSGLAGALKGIFGGKYGDVTQLAAFGGLSALLNKLMTQRPDPVGYQGGIPQYTVTRTQTPMAQQRPVSYESIPSKEGEAAATVMRQVPYRPGQGGITYFNPIQYNYTGKDLAAPTLAAPPAGGTTGSGSNTDFDNPLKDPYIPPKSGGSGRLVSNTIGDDFGSLIDPREKGSGTAADYASLERAAGVSGKAAGGYMPGGIAMLAGGRYLRGPGDGVSDSIPAKFERSGQPARLADGEFVIDARTVSEIGNGSSEAGARKLYAMMDRVHKARKTAKRGKPSGADKYLPK